MVVGFGNILLGGIGNDRVYGRAGHDVLLGGDDADRVRGGYDDDLVVGGTSDTVNHTATDAALRAILADWVNNRPAVPAGLGMLLGDAEKDLLLGGLGRDLFHDGDEDRIYDFRIDEGDKEA